MQTKSFLLFLASCFMPLVAVCQSAFSQMDRDHNFTACSYGLYPENDLPRQTPAPAGYTPFYISHYGRHGSRYMNDMKGFKEPYKTLHQADSLGKLSEAGKMALREISLYIADAEGRWGDLTELGKMQQRGIAHRMLQNYPEVFSDGAYIDARSTIVTRCAISMGAFVLQLIKERPDLQVSMFNSYSDMWYMNHQNKLRNAANNRRGQLAVGQLIMQLWHQDRRMGLFFNDSAYVRQHVDLQWLAYYLVKASLTQRNTERSGEPNPLLHFFDSDEFYFFWQIENAWTYLQSGFCKLNGAKQPYLQAYLLDKIVSEADSIIAIKQHGASLRFGHETVLLPLVCLTGINGYDLSTANLGELEKKGWWASNVYPMAGNLQFIFYRKDADDNDPLVKVLLNEREATLPLPSNIAPYYRWRDVRAHFLQKVAEGKSALGVER